MPYSVDPSTDNCYEGTACLINKLGIHDEKLLAKVEAEITFAKASMLESAPVSDKFDMDHYLSIHRFLFEDLYDWAGTLRTVDISKKQTNFCNAENLPELMNACFAELKRNNLYVGLSRKEYIDRIVDFYCTTNMLHPFREGNGRTQRIFIAQLIRHNGYSFTFQRIDKDELIIATIMSASGVTDYLRDLFDKSICEG